MSDEHREENPRTDDDRAERIKLEEIVAYLDGELRGKAREAVEAKVTLDAEVRSEADALRRTWELLDYLPRAEASSNFTSRTMERLVPIAAEMSRTAPISSGSSSPATARPRFSRPVLFAFVLVFLAGLGGAIGYFGHRLIFPVEPTTSKNLDALSIADLRIIENLDLYRPIDDLAFLQELDQSDWFADDQFEFVAPPQAQRQDYLRQQLAEFQALPPSRQANLRELDEELHALPEDEQAQLTSVMIEYAGWLRSLPEEHRREIESLPPDQRAERVLRLREERWVRSLPAFEQEKLRNASMEERNRLIVQWRQADRQFRDEWRWGAGHWTELQANRFSLPLASQEFRDELRTFLDTKLKPRLNQMELARLELAEMALKEGAYIRFARTVVDLADRHPILPGRDYGPTSFAELPSHIRDVLLAEGINANTPVFRRTRGKWPEFGIAIAEWARRRDVRVPEQLGPSKPSEFDPEVRDAIVRLERQLRKSKQADLKRLRETQGTWPDYPRLLRELAMRENVHIPGVMLPGSPAIWDKFRRKR